MKKHVKIYLEANGYTVADFIPCRKCGAPSNDIHHIQPKGMGGRKNADVIENLIALCRDCHNKAHDNKISKEELFNILKYDK